MEEKASKDKESVEDLEIDTFDLLEGKMSNVAINRLHKQLVSS
ncbi:MAG: hypothetical protein ACREBI_11655 [Nitrosotalea sp.]